jgi:hypothetical protein
MRALIYERDTSASKLAAFYESGIKIKNKSAFGSPFNPHLPHLQSAQHFTTSREILVPHNTSHTRSSKSKRYSRADPRQLGIQGEALLVGSTSKFQRIATYKFWDKFKFKSSMNFKGIQTFLKKPNKFYKISYPHPILDYKFIFTHLYLNIESSFTSGNRYLMYFILNRLGHLRLLPSLS